MPKADNPHAVRLYNSLSMHADEQTAARIAHAMPLSKSADIHKKHMWAERVCDDLQREFDDETIRKIRMDCACGPETGKMDKLKRIYQSASGLDDFAAKANALN